MRPADDTALGNTPRIQPAGDDRLVQVARWLVVPQKTVRVPGQHLRVHANQNHGYSALHRRGPAGRSEIHPR